LRSPVSPKAPCAWRLRRRALDIGDRNRWHPILNRWDGHNRIGFIEEEISPADRGNHHGPRANSGQSRVPLMLGQSLCLALDERTDLEQRDRADGAGSARCTDEPEQRFRMRLGDSNRWYRLPQKVSRQDTLDEACASKRVDVLDGAAWRGCSELANLPSDKSIDASVAPKRPEQRAVDTRADRFAGVGKRSKRATNC
jgi:hypothetical protein